MMYIIYNIIVEDIREAILFLNIIHDFYPYQFISSCRVRCHIYSFKFNMYFEKNFLGGNYDFKSNTGSIVGGI